MIYQISCVNDEIIKLEYKYITAIYRYKQQQFFEVAEILLIQFKTLKTQPLYVQIYTSLHLVGKNVL